MNNLNDKQRLFVAEYIKDHSSTDAALRAGYNKDYGRKLLKLNAVQEAVSQHIEQVEEEAIVTAEMVVQGLLKEANTAESDTARVNAWRLLGKHLGLFSTRLQHGFENNADVEVVIEYPSEVPSPDHIREAT